MPKRRCSTDNSDTKKAKLDETENAEFAEILRKIRESESEEISRKYAKRLKLLLSDEQKIRKFVTVLSNVDQLCAIFSNHTCVMGTSEYWSEVHQLSISILANCCFTVPKTGFLIRKAKPNFLELSVRLFESTSANAEVKSSMCRLLANLCSNKELVVTWISSNTIIFDQIALLLESSDTKIVKQCLRIFSILANSSLTRVIMLSNGGFCLGKLLSNAELRDEVVKILKVLLKRHAKVLDRQLSTSNCSENIVQLFFEENGRNRQFVIDLFSNTVCTREQMENDEFMNKLLESQLPERIRMLAAFAQTAWGRASLRTSGALDVLINRLATSQDENERLTIVNSFRHLIHYTAGMRYLSESAEFVNTVVSDVNRYVDSHKSNCNPTVDMDFVTKLSQKLELLNETDRNDKNQQMAGRLHKDFYLTSWSYSTPSMSPRGLGSTSNSPYYFSPSPSYSQTSSNQSSGPSSPKIRRSEGILDELSDVESDHDAEPITEKRNKTDKSIVETELWLLGFQSQDDHNLQFLVRPDVVDCVIAYLRNTNEPDFRLYRILRRMATLRAHVHQLIDMQFHVRVLTCLCAAPCRLLKYSKTCKQCEGCSEHGKEILREFARHVDSSYGDAHINTMFNNDDFVDRTKYAIAKVVLVKERIRAAKIPAVDELFESLIYILESEENFDKYGKVQTYINGPTLCSQIIGALSTLITGQKIKDLCEKDSWYFPRNGKCEVASVTPRETDEKLMFTSKENEEFVETASMEKICEKSLYFQGMFSSDFVEKTEKIRNFEIDADPSIVRIFVHLLSCCTAECSAIESAEQCAKLLELSDRYLCPEISTNLCANDGPLRTFLTGPSLQILLPVALITNAHPTLLDTVYLTLVRFASSCDVTRSLEHICKKTNAIVISTFVTTFRSFLTVD